MKGIYKELKVLRKKNKKLFKKNKELKKRLHKVEHPEENVNVYTLEENIKSRLLIELYFIDVTIYKYVEEDSLEDVLIVLNILGDTKLPLILRLFRPSLKRMYKNIANLYTKYSFIYEQCRMYLNLEVR